MANQENNIDNSEIEQQYLQETPEETIKETLQETCQETLPETLPEVLSETLPEVLSETLPEVLSETLPEVLSETLQETLPETLQETNEMVLETPQSKVSNAVSTDTGSANIPGRDNERKLFVGGLTRETTEDDLKAYFTQYGSIESVCLKMDPHTQRSKGFAFIVFSSAEAIVKVTEAGEHVINNKKVDTQLPKSKQGKVFVGGITAELSEEDIKSYFNQFGNVAEIQMPFDKVKNQRKNFCFVIFNSDDMIEELLKTPKALIKNVEVDVKRAFLKSNSSTNERGFAHQQGGVPFRQNATAQWHGQNWNSNPMFGGYGFDQRAYGNAYAGDGYNNGYENAYAGYGGFANQAYTNIPAPNRNNGVGFTRGTGRGAARRGAGRNTNRGANNAGSGNGNVRYQPY